MQFENLNIPPLNENIISCLSAIYKSDVTYEYICDKIAKDMGLIQKIFFIANSQLYSNGNKTSNLKEAIIRIGITNLTTILTSEYYNQYKKFDGIEFFDIKSFNKHSIFVSKLCFEIANAIHIEKKFDLMLAGTFHDIGLLVRAINQPDKMKLIIEKCRNEKISIYNAEISLQILTHDQLGFTLLEKWGFNQQVLELVKYHHTPSHHRTNSIDYLEKEFDILELVNQISNKYSFGFHSNNHHAKINPVLLDKISITKDSLSKLLNKVILSLNIFSSALL